MYKVRTIEKEIISWEIWKLGQGKGTVHTKLMRLGFYIFEKFHSRPEFYSLLNMDTRNLAKRLKFNLLMQEH